MNDCYYQGCSKSFKHKSDLADHINVIHLNIQKYVCKICEKAFNFKKSLRKRALVFAAR